MINKDFLQAVRLLDVFVIAPILIKNGIDTKNNIITVIGIGTLIFNGINFINDSR